MENSNVIYLFNQKKPQFINTADSFAYQEIILNKMNFVSFNKEHNKGSFKEQMQFGIDYANSCAKYTVDLLMENSEDRLPQIITQFACAVVDLQDVEFAEGLHTLRQLILQKIPHFCLQDGNNIMIKSSIAHNISLTVLEEIYFNQDNFPCVINILNRYYS